MRAEDAKKRGCSFENYIQLMREDDATDADLTELGRKQVLVLWREWVLVLEGKISTAIGG